MSDNFPLTFEKYILERENLALLHGIINPLSTKVINKQNEPPLLDITIVPQILAIRRNNDDDN